MSKKGPLKLGFLLGAIGAQLGVHTLRSWRRRRNIENLPTSKIATAASGECEFQGVAWPTDKASCRTPLGHSAVYFDFKLEKEVREGKSTTWKTVHRKQSGEPFLLADSSGLAMIVPTEAQLEATWDWWAWDDLSEERQEKLARDLPGIAEFPPKPGFFGLMPEAKFRVGEQVLCPGSPLLVHGTFHPDAHGFFVTPHAGFSEFKKEAMRWLSAPEAALLSRFDVNEDGRISDKELKAGFYGMAKAAAGGGSRGSYTPPPIPPGAIRCAGRVIGGKNLIMADCFESHAVERQGSHHWAKLIGAAALIALGAFVIMQTW